MEPNMSMTTTSGRESLGGFSSGGDDPRAASSRVWKGTDQPRQTVSAAAPELAVELQQQMPEGSGALVEERQMLPWLIGGLATAGLIIGAIIIGWSSGWAAAATGIVWLLMGYAVAWSVVWGAGLLRARDEEIVEAKVVHGEVPPPPGRTD